MLVGNLGFLLCINILLIGLTYLRLHNMRKQIGFQLSMNMANLAGGIVAFITGVILIYQFPLKFVLVTIISTLVGMLVGGIFGRLFNHQALLTGFINGLMLGIMAPMVGAAAQNSFIFLAFLELIFFLSMFLLIFAAKYEKHEEMNAD
ncbi:hypothetical protein [Lederbergia lenta]|uniref:Uncharacterized protein n=1 Tax=Lederbergia lenta TaxID=1467 RepID=A0A2X4WCW8_LEDLE|nr:hypothetical protein [Lederbergia lenta]MEC2322889.1 hypothetical protein [Lederbergia lenta]SQI61966.1 Uncharacterised protein [Lederbergia lenta]